MSTSQVKPKTLIRDSRYCIPFDTMFKRYKCRPDDTTVRNRFLASDEQNLKTSRPSEIEGHDILFARIAFAVNQKNFE